MDFRSSFVRQGPILLEGALGERLKREYGLRPDPHVAWAALVRSGEGRAALWALWYEYRTTAAAHHLPFAATTPTRRANRDRVGRSSYGDSLLADNVDFLRRVQDSAQGVMYIGGLMGCKGDAYRATEVLSAEEARSFHRWQAQSLAHSGVDFLYAGIMPAVTEAMGMACAMAETGLPYIISLMIRENGRLIDGTAIHDAITRIDGGADVPPLCYMTNCVHPRVLHAALSAPWNRTPLVRERFCGIQANTSPLSPEELDGSQDLKSSDAAELTAAIMDLREFISLKIVGGCCGTDNSHMTRIAEALTQDQCASAF